MKSIISIFFIAIQLTACSHRLNWHDYQKRCIKIDKSQAQSILLHAYYCGTKNGSDYVYFNNIWGCDDYEEVECGVLSVEKFPFTDDREKWVVVYPPKFYNFEDSIIQDVEKNIMDNNRYLEIK